MKNRFKYRQGRRKKQVEANAKVTYYSLILFLVAFSVLAVERFISLFL